MTESIPEFGNVEASVSYFLGYRLDPACHVLDIGTNKGSLVSQLYRSGYSNIIGIDTENKAIEYGKLTYPEIADRLVEYDGKVIPFEDNRYDVVTMFDVLEHLPDPERYLREVRRVLKPDGLFIFQTPNRYTNIPWEIIQAKSLTRWKTFHCSLQTLSSLRHLLSKAEFTEIKIEKYILYTSYNLERIKRVIGPLGPILLRVLKFLPLFMSPNFWGSCHKPVDFYHQLLPEDPQFILKRPEE